MKGIILAGGTGSRLYPSTFAISKQLLPVFDKPMIYYPLSVLMLANIRDILIISTPLDLKRFEFLLKDGSDLGLNIKYKKQNKPKGLAHSFIISKDFIKNDNVCLILGDNIFYGHDFSSILKECSKLEKGGKIFGYRVQDPKRYGVVEFDKNFKVLNVEEKPKNPKSNFVIPGLYFFSNDVLKIARSLKPSKRNELEITDVMKEYILKDELDVKVLGRGYAWLDAGTFEDLQKASVFVQTIQDRQGVKIACLEEVSYKMGFIGKKKLISLSKKYQNEYGKYLKELLT